MGSSSPQVGSDGFPDLCGQGQSVALTTLAAHIYLSQVPVNVTEFERYYFPYTQSQAR